jgi:hypothetical protein
VCGLLFARFSQLLFFGIAVNIPFAAVFNPPTQPYSPISSPDSLRRRWFALQHDSPQSSPAAPLP